MLRCPRCKKIVYPNDKYCSNCREELYILTTTYVCFDCRKDIRIEYVVDNNPSPPPPEYCPQCGSRDIVDASTIALESSPAFGGWEYKNCGEGVIVRVPIVKDLKQIERQRRQAEVIEKRKNAYAEWQAKDNATKERWHAEFQAKEKATKERWNREAEERKKRVKNGKGSIFDKVIEFDTWLTQEK